MALRSNLEPLEYLQILIRRKWVIIFSVLTMVAVGCFYIIKTPPIYKSSTMILIIPQRVPDAILRTTASGWLEERLRILEPLLMSRSRLMTIIREFNLFRGSGLVSEDAMVMEMRRRIDVNTQGRDSFTLSFKHEDPMTAMLLTKRLASIFFEENTRIWTRQSHETTEFVEQQMKDAKKILEREEQKIRDYKFKNLGELPSQVETHISTIRVLQERYKTIEDTIRSLEDKQSVMLHRDQSLTKSINSILQEFSSDNIPENSGSPTASNPDPMQSLYNDHSTKRARINELLMKYTDSYPEIKRLKAEVDQVERRIREEGKTAPSGGKTEVKSQVFANPGSSSKPIQKLLTADMDERIYLRSQMEKAEKDIKKLQKEQERILTNITTLQGKIQRSPAHEEEIAKLTRDFDKYRATYYQMRDRRTQLELSEAMEKNQEQERYQILDPANLPKSPFGPNIWKVFKYALLGGFALGIGGAMGLEILSGKIRGVKDFKHYSKIPVLASVSVIKGLGYSRRSILPNVIIASGLASFAAYFCVIFIYYPDKIMSILYTLKGVFGI